MEKAFHGFEFQRQLAHITFGICILWGIHFNIFSTAFLGGMTLVIMALLFAIKKGFKIPLFYPVLCYFERKDHLDCCPGKGLFFFLLGAFLTVAFFPKAIAMASLAILLIGDAITNLVGSHFGRIKNPLNKKKTIEGTLAGIGASFLVCLLFFPIIPSLLAATVAMMMEIPHFTIGRVHLDDNVLVPLSAALSLYLFSLLSLS